MRLMRLMGVAAAAAVLATCGDPPVVPPPKPVAGQLSVRLTTPHSDDAALLVRVTGPTAMTGVVAGDGAYVVHSRAEAKAFNAAVFGDFAAGVVVLKFTVPDVAKFAEYAAALVEVADETNAVRAQLTGYAVVVEK